MAPTYIHLGFWAERERGRRERKGNASTQRATVSKSSLLPIQQAEAELLKRNHGSTESIRLEKTSKIIKSNSQPNNTMPAKPCPKVPHLHVL